MPRKLAILLCVLAVPACANDGHSEAEPRVLDANISSHIAQAFAAHDQDGNGTLSKSEAGSHPMLAAHFDEADVDGDGVLTQDEVLQLASELHETACDDAECPSHAEGHDAHVASVFATLDANRDGFVTPAEADGHHLADIFTRVDADGDARITLAEVRALAATHTGGH
jgi:Ca2+-binding EF-hand superfamily protein